MREILEILDKRVGNPPRTELGSLPWEFRRWARRSDSRCYQEPGFEDEDVRVMEYTNEGEMPVRTVSAQCLNISTDIGLPLLESGDEPPADIVEYKRILGQHHEAIAGSRARFPVAVPDHLHGFLDPETSFEGHDLQKEIPGTILYEDGTSDPVLVTSYDEFENRIESPAYRDIYTGTEDWHRHVDYGTHRELVEKIDGYGTPFPILVPNLFTEDGEDGNPSNPAFSYATVACVDEFMVEGYDYSDFDIEGGVPALK